jgi:hypothetical protein
MNILVIGAGWYGCHLSKYLMDKGHKVTIVDKTNTIFSGASSKNQNRLHLGFHYPRARDTIKECQSGFYKFKELYGSLLEPITNNYYFISNYGSKITMAEYVKIFEPTDFVECSLKDMPLSITNVNDTVLRVNEEYINPKKSIEYFKKYLMPYFCSIDSPQTFSSVKAIVDYVPVSFDYIINCSFNHLEPIEYDHYELYVSFLYKIDTDDIFAYTIMDGEFFSIYPYDIKQCIYTVTSVKHGVLLSIRDSSIDYSNMDTEIMERKQIVDNEIKEYINDWSNKAVYVDYFLSWKTKPKTMTDDRSLQYKIADNVISFYGGKITGIFHAQDILEGVINAKL